MVPKVKPIDLLKSWKIVKGDVVQVMTGKYAGQQGKVLRVQRDRNALIVEGINLVRINGDAYIFSSAFRLNDTFLLTLLMLRREAPLQWNNQFKSQMLL